MVKFLQFSSFQTASKQYEKAEDEFYKISDVDFYYSKQVDEQLGKLAQELRRPVRRTKRPPDFSNAPVPHPLPAPTIIPVQPPSDPPVLIRIPNPNPNHTP